MNNALAQPQIILETGSFLTMLFSGGEAVNGTGYLAFLFYLAKNKVIPPITITGRCLSEIFGNPSVMTADDITMGRFKVSDILGGFRKIDTRYQLINEAIKSGILNIASPTSVELQYLTELATTYNLNREYIRQQLLHPDQRAYIAHCKHKEIQCVDNPKIFKEAPTKVPSDDLGEKSIGAYIAEALSNSSKDPHKFFVIYEGNDDRGIMNRVTYNLMYPNANANVECDPKKSNFKSTNFSFLKDVIQVSTMGFLAASMHLTTI